MGRKPLKIVNGPRGPLFFGPIFGPEIISDLISPNDILKIYYGPRHFGRANREINE